MPFTVIISDEVRKVVAVFIEEAFMGSMWGRNLYISLTEKLRSKRIAYIEVFDSCPAECETVFVISANFEWTQKTVRALNLSGRTPILLCNQFESLPGCIYSCVCSDINASMRDVLDLLKNKKKSTVALYGMNPNSISDLGRANSLFAWNEPAIAHMEVFENQGSLESCFQTFLPKADSFDAVICTNDFVAVSLVRRLLRMAPELLDRLTVISCAETRLSAYYHRYITTLSVNFSQYGAAAVSIYESLKKQDYVANMMLRIRWTLSDDVQKPTALPAVSLPQSVRGDTFYSDPELRKMNIADKLLNLADDVDKEILEKLLSGESYLQIAEATFLSEGSVKYRIKKLVERSGAADKHELLAVLRDYTTQI